jgi:purine-nucleoside phosphorylase
MVDLYEKVMESADWIRSSTAFSGTKAIVLGTGMDAFTKDLEITHSVPYTDIPHFPVSSVKSHEGRLICARINEIPIFILSGRFHYYEGYSARELTFPVRVLKSLGVDHIILTNAAGGINPHYQAGDLVVVRDHINLMPDNPLRGPDDPRLGLRFPDMLHAYDPEINDTFLQLAKKENLRLHTGVYLGLQGPSLETPAEYRMAHILGADVLGMSTVPEVIVARHEYMKVTVFSIVSNVCFPTSSLTKTTLEEIIAVVQSTSSKLSRLLHVYFETLQH